MKRDDVIILNIDRETDDIRKKFGGIFDMHAGGGAIHNLPLPD